MKYLPIILTTLLVSLALLFACKSDDGFSIESGIEIISLNTENAYKGSQLQTPVVIKVNSTIPYQELRIVCVQTNGSGYAIPVDSPFPSFFGIAVDDSYEAHMILSLGCDENQTYKFTLIRRSTNTNINESQELTSIEVDIQASDNPSGWRKLCGAPSMELLAESASQSYLALNYSEEVFSSPNALILGSKDYLDWTELGGIDAYAYDLQVTNNNVLHALTTDGVYARTDGSNWEQWPGFPFTEEDAVPASLLAEDSVAFVTIESSSQFLSQTYRSRDQGVTWELLPVEAIQIQRLTNGHLIALSEQNGIYRSVNSGATWESVVLQSPKGFITSMEVISQSELVIREYEEFGDSQSVYRFDLNNNQFTEVLSTQESILDITVKDGIIYVLGNETIFKIDGTVLEMINGPDYFIPESTFRPVFGGYHRLVVVNETDFIAVIDGQQFANF